MLCRMDDLSFEKICLQCKLLALPTLLDTNNPASEKDRLQLNPNFAIEMCF